MVVSKERNILIENVEPSVDGGRYPAKMIVGETCRVEADIFTEGHEPLLIRLCWRIDSEEWKVLPMSQDGNDRWNASFHLDRVGEYEFTFQDHNGRGFSPIYRVVADRALARFGAWYEMFVRSQGRDPARSGTFQDAERRLAD